MRNKKLKLSAILLFGLGLTEILAQEAIPATGGNASGSGGSVSYTIGQIVYMTNIGTNGSVTQGIQQPYEILVITGIPEAKDITIEILVYPNPVTDNLKLEIKNYEIQNLRYKLYDNNGKLLQENKIEGNETNIIMNNLIPAIYFLKVTDNKKIVKTFKIIKK
jgi:Secretion system C-terminal sorting domain